MAQNENTVNETTQDEILASILQKISPPQAPSSATPNCFSGGDILSSLLSNPELISKLPSLLSSIKPILDMLKSTGAPPPPSSATTAVQIAESATEASAPKDTPTSIVRHPPGADSRTALLCAMKPYLSRDRQNAIDYIVKIGRLGDILKTL